MSRSFTGRRALRRIGRGVTIVNRVAKTDGNGDPVRDNHGNIEWDSPSTADIPADIVFDGNPTFSRIAYGIEREIDAIAYVPTDESVYDGRDDETRRATRIKYDGEDYAVRQTYDEGNGITRCHCEIEENY